MRPARMAINRESSYQLLSKRKLQLILPIRQLSVVNGKLLIACEQCLRPPKIQNENFNPSSPIRGAVWVDKIFPKVALVNVVFGFPSTV